MIKGVIILVKNRMCFPLLVTLILLFSLFPASLTSTASLPLEGHLAPDFTVPLLHGDFLSLQDFKGTPVIINFWATWCPPCRVEMPILQDFYDKQDVIRLIAISSGESLNTVASFIKTNGYTFPIGLDSSTRVSRDYLIRFLPTTFLLDAEGIIRQKHIGILTEEIVEGWLQEYAPSAN